MPDTSVHYRISGAQNILLKSTAVLLDGLGLFLTPTVIGAAPVEFIGVMGGIGFLVWFWMLGANYLGGKTQSKILTVLGNTVMEAIPFVNGFYPGFSVEAWRLISIMRQEDEEKARTKALKDEKIDARRAQQQARALEIRSAQQAANDHAEEAQAA
jgi:hypothetical protein